MVASHCPVSPFLDRPTLGSANIISHKIIDCNNKYVPSPSSPANLSAEKRRSRSQPSVTAFIFFSALVVWVIAHRAMIATATCRRRHVTRLLCLESRRMPMATHNTLHGWSGAATGRCLAPRTDVIRAAVMQETMVIRRGH